MAETVARTGYHHGDLARAALDCAIATIDASGAESVSMRAVAADLGVTHRALYRHYHDREALLVACAAEGYGALLEAAGSSANLREFGEAYLRFALARPRLYEEMMRSHAVHRSEIRDGAASSLIAYARTVIGNDATVQRVWVMLHGGLTLHAAGALRARDDDALVDLLLSMIEDISK